MSREHTVDASQIHHDWDASREPVVTIESGDVVHFDLPITGEGQVTETRRSRRGLGLRHDLQPCRAGPRRGRQPGATRSRSRSSRYPGRVGLDGDHPGLGLLADDFPDAFLKICDLRGRHDGDGRARRRGPARSPFLGTMGVADRRARPLSPFPPHRGGGNIDNRHLVAGSTLWLPIWCDGALFSCGDAHAAQGDGEVCVSAIECGMQATLRFALHKRTIPARLPRARPRSRLPGAVPRDDGDRRRPDGGRRKAVRDDDRVARRGARLDAARTPTSLQPRRRPADPRDRRRRRLERRHDDAARRLRLNSPRRSGQRRRR